MFRLKQKIVKTLTDLDSKLASNIEQHPDPLPSDSMDKHSESQFLKSLQHRTWTATESIDAAETKTTQSTISFTVAPGMGPWLRDSLLELLVVFNPVTDDSDHFTQLGHHLLLLLRLHLYSQVGGKGRYIL